MRAWKMLIGAALLCATVQAELVRDVKAADIHNGDSGYVADNSIWFTSEADLSVWKRVREVFATKDVETYQAIILKERQAWQFVSGPMRVKVVTYFSEQHEICVKLLEKGRFEGTDWWVDDKDYSKTK
jgi:hypothetical protein